MNSTTQEALYGLQKILEGLLDFQRTNEGNLIYNQNFDAEIIKKAILAEFEHGCQGSSPHVIILEPEDNPNSDQAILDAANMYKIDFNLLETDYLDIVANEAIFCRLMRCQAQWPQLRPLLGQWHTSKDFCLVLIVLFSSYGLLNLARRLGVRFLDKFEAAVDYRTTSRVLDLLWVARDTLAAASPLFPSTGKSNYSVAIAQHLSTLTKYPKLNEILKYVGAFRLPRTMDEKPICFGFDEAFETFGVHFIKQNINGNIINEAKLKANIKAAQEERDRVDLLLSEYLEDTSISQSKRAVDSRRKMLWELVDDLVVIFGMMDPLSHDIFKDLEPPEIHKEGCEKLIACYNSGLERMQMIYKQDVIKSEPRNAQGRRALGICRTKHKDYVNQKKITKQKRRHEEIQPEPQVDNGVPKKRRKILEHEEEILSRLLSYKERIPTHVYDKILQSLGSEWDKKRVYNWWNYRVNKNN
ncbi:hypothetical protein GLOIN_2v1482460 [Rhizophagus clarus]|uniref:Uncharacterized protein n=1 Tax=Rhizophagus clarus TaxID=94130 RepID=A0A8H3M139_9GLOM|nr:hypothetical protein GLOIN_2v1482460 [Rhizophagus clarus]